MRIQDAKIVYNSLNHNSFICEVGNDFNEEDQYYVRIFYNNKQVIVRGTSLYNLKLVFVGVNFKVENLSFIDIERGTLKSKIKNSKINY